MPIVYNIVYNVIHLSCQMIIQGFYSIYKKKISAIKKGTRRCITIQTYYLRIEHFSQDTTQMFVSGIFLFPTLQKMASKLPKTHLLGTMKEPWNSKQFLFPNAFLFPLKTKTLINFIILDLKSALSMIWNNPISAKTQTQTITLLYR